MSLLDREDALCKAVLLGLVLAGVGCSGARQPTPTAASPPVDRQLALTGIVVESGTHVPVRNARVCIHDSSARSGPNTDICSWSGLSGPDGSYKIVSTGPVANCPWVYGSDFEIRQDCVTFTYPETIWSPSVQRKIRMEAGQTAAFTVFADDISGTREGDYCVACKRIRIVAGRNGRLTVRLTPENAGLRLASDYPDLRPNEPFPVTAEQEVTVLVMTEGPSAVRSFELSTAFIAD
jgi:hypothetical protein